MHNLYSLLKTWKLPLAMIIGVVLYYALRPLMNAQEETVFYYSVSHYVQPTLIFTMLFLSFLKVEPRNLKPHRWHGVLLLTQGSLFVVCSLLAIAFAESDGTAKLLLEGAMLCFICPTATASAVIVQKLGGSLSGDVTYLILCNLMVSILAPMFLPLVEPEINAIASHSTAAAYSSLFSFHSTFSAMVQIMGKVFPLLLCPLFVAMIVRHYAPQLMQRLLSVRDMAFYLWLVALALAITVTVRTIVESSIAVTILAGFAAISALCCVIQFWLGRTIGRSFPQPLANPSAPRNPNSTHIADPVERSAVTAGQAFGQKNTVFVIWMGLVFLNPVTSVVGGFYSIWHNVINSWQLYEKSKKVS